MGRKVGYLFSGERDLDNALQTSRQVLGINKATGETPGPNTSNLFVKITAIIDETGSKEATAVEVVFDGDQNDFVAPPSPWIFDSENISDDQTTTNIHSDESMSVDDVLHVLFYPDQEEKSQWLALSKGGGGAERPVIISAGSNFAFGAIITSPTDLTPIKVFTAEDGTTFKSIMPWGATVDLPADYRYIADLVETTYFDQDYPKTLWARPSQSYPASGGITSFNIYDARTTNGNSIFIPLDGEELILEDFDNAGASSTAKNYFNGKFFTCSYNHNDGNFYFDHPLF